MNKVHRQGVDIRIAFTSQANCPTTDALTQNTVKPVSPLNKLQLTYSAVIYNFKRLLRPIVKFLYRHIFKPLARPLAFKFRQYLVTSIRQEISQSMFAQISEQTNALMLRELKLIQSNLLLEMKALGESFLHAPCAHQDSSREGMVAELSQELQKHISECDVRLAAIEQR